MAKWKPDLEFIKFLEWREEKEGNVATTLNGERLTELMKRGEETGREIYERLYQIPRIQKEYQKWKKMKK